MASEAAPFTYIEPSFKQPIFCEGVASVEVINGRMHFALFVKQPSLDGTDAIERVINLRVIIPNDAVAAALPTVIRKLSATAQQFLRSCLFLEPRTH